MSRESFIAINRLYLFTTTNVTFLKALGARKNEIYPLIKQNSFYNDKVLHVFYFFSTKKLYHLKTIGRQDND